MATYSDLDINRKRELLLNATIIKLLDAVLRKITSQSQVWQTAGLWTQQAEGQARPLVEAMSDEEVERIIEQLERDRHISNDREILRLFTTEMGEGSSL